MLLLSEPGVDFRGGEFYLVEPKAGGVGRRRVFEWETAGEVILFASGGGGGGGGGGDGANWHHGMCEVRMGSAEERGEATSTERFAVGIFH